MTIPAVRRGNCLVSAAKAVRAAEPLTRLIACSVADHVLDDLSAAANLERVDSELALMNAFAQHEDVSMEVSPTLAAILMHAQEAARHSGGLVDPVVGVAPSSVDFDPDDHRFREPYRFDADERRLYLRRGTVLDLWSIGCAWAAEEIVAKVVVEDPAATLAVVVGPAVVAIGAAWEISEVLDTELNVLDSPLRCGLRSFAVVDHELPPFTVQETHGDQRFTPSMTAGGPWWDRAVVGAEDAVQALTFALMAERLGEEAVDHIVASGGEAEFVGSRSGTPLRRRMRTPGWSPKN